jgi:hypothetical protein
VVIAGSDDGWAIDSDPVNRIRALRDAIDQMLRHPRAHPVTDDGR